MLPIIYYLTDFDQQTAVHPDWRKAFAFMDTPYDALQPCVIRVLEPP